MQPIAVLIVAENPLARMGLAALLTGFPGLTIAGQSSGASLSSDLDLYNPDVIAWDWGWQPFPDLPGDVPVVALLKESGQAAEAWGAGARGLLVGEIEAEALVAALVAVAQGLAVIEPSLVGALAGASAPGDMPADPLTPREKEVLQLLAEGLPNKLIALRLAITDHTVKFHVNAIMGKLGVQSRTEAVVRATRLGLIIL